MHHNPKTTAKRYKVLLSAYACEPGKGSEPGVGWNMACNLARRHYVWVITRSNNRPAIEAALRSNPVTGLHFLYYDLPAWAAWWKRGQRGLQLYYYLWQIGIGTLAKQSHAAVGFDIAHHVTLGKYWAPSFLHKLDLPFVWGPVGGGESTPRGFLRKLGVRGVAYETVRVLARWIGERDPLVRKTIHRASLALVSSAETRKRLDRLGTRHIAFIPGQTGLNEEDISALQTSAEHKNSRFVFVSVGRLLHWKGLHLAIYAFQKARLSNAEYWILGSGPEFRRLNALVRRLGLENQVRFFGNMPRTDVLDHLRKSHVLVHPSLHDFSPTVCLEAMGASMPVLCLDIGGPAMQVTEETGVRISITNQSHCISEMSSAMRRLAENPDWCRELGEAGCRRVKEHFTWAGKAALISELYEHILTTDRAPALETGHGAAEPIVI